MMAMTTSNSTRLKPSRESVRLRLAAMPAATMPMPMRASVEGSGTGTMSSPRKAPDALEIDVIEVPTAALPESIAVKTWVGKDGTEYVVAPIPLGGYVKMLGQEDTSMADLEAITDAERQQSFSGKPFIRLFNAF